MNFPVMAEFAKWGQELARKTNGAIEIEALPIGAVVPVTDTLDAMRSGVLTGHFSGAPYFAGKDPAFAVMGDTLAAYENAAQRNRWFDEGGGLALARKLLLGGATVMRRFQHIRIGFVVDGRGPGLQKLSLVLSAIAAAIFLAGLFWGAFWQFHESVWAFDEERWMPETTGRAWDVPLPPVIRFVMVVAVALFLCQALLTYARRLAASER